MSHLVWNPNVFSNYTHRCKQSGRKLLQKVVINDSQQHFSKSHLFETFLFFPLASTDAPNLDIIIHTKYLGEFLPPLRLYPPQLRVALFMEKSDGLR